MHGKVADSLIGKGIPGAVFDMWHTFANGKYEFQDPENQSDSNLRGKFRCDENGECKLYCLKPAASSLPTDGRAGAQSCSCSCSGADAC
jgi:protocatechuate 3,4-dioxygenase beta subunit